MENGWRSDRRLDEVLVAGQVSEVPRREVGFVVVAHCLVMKDPHLGVKQDLQIPRPGHTLSLHKSVALKEEVLVYTGRAHFGGSPLMCWEPAWPCQLVHTRSFQNL